MIRYFDTSALVPYYRPEPASETCEALLMESADGVLLSDLVQVEVASVLARLVRMGELTEGDAQRIHQAFTADVWQGRFRPLRLEPSHLTRARDWLLQRTTPLRTLDALHLAAAAEVGAELVTADGPLAIAARHFGVAVLHVVS